MTNTVWSEGVYGSVVPANIQLNQVYGYSLLGPTCLQKSFLSPLLRISYYPRVECGYSQPRIGFGFGEF